MKDKKLQIFVSSTYTDLIEERQAAVEAILSSGHIPAGMELFSAGDESQMTVIERWIDESDIYLLILGGRYGSIDVKTGKSYTHLEYEYALKQNKPLFAVVIKDQALDEKVKTKGRAVLEDLNPKLLNDFRSLVLQNLVKFWEDKKDIKISIHETLSEFSNRKDMIGWIRGDNNINTAILAEEIARLTKENFELRNQIANTTQNSGPLYVSLSYSELEKLLKSNYTKYEGSEINLFDLILKFGEDLSNDEGFHTDGKSEAFELLCKFRLVKEIGSTFYAYRLTDDGYNFYLRALVLKLD